MWDWTSAVPDTGLATFGVQPSVETLYLFSVAQIANLPYRRLQIGRALAVFRRPARAQSCRMASCDTAQRGQAATKMDRGCGRRPSRSALESRPCCGWCCYKPRSENSSRLATIL